MLELENIRVCTRGTYGRFKRLAFPINNGSIVNKVSFIKGNASYYEKEKP